MTHPIIRKKLSELLKNEVKMTDHFDVEITGLCIDSRQLKTGELFFAYSGVKSDGRQFIKQAVESGAAAILYEAEDAAIAGNEFLIPMFPINNLAEKIGHIAAIYYDHPSRDLTVIAATGTNGKTSCCQHIAQALEMLGEKAGVFGTIGNGLFGTLEPSQLTTLDAISLQKQLAAFKKEGAHYICMEASSHGLVQGRLNGVEVDVAVFTNLSREHLDYHKSMEEYGQAKAKLFQFPGLKTAVINLDDEFGYKLIQLCRQNNLNTHSYSVQANNTLSQVAHCNTHQIHLDMSGITATLHTPWGAGVLHSRLLGRFNLSNLLATVSVLGVLGFSFTEVLNIMPELSTVNGRMQVFGGENLPYVVVDFAHTPDALKQILSSLRELTDNEIWCIFGCGGERDSGKRPLMGKFAESMADHVILTNDNPRSEDAHKIITDILQGMLKPERVIIEHDRKRAIKHAISCANKNDVILIAGKGHERYQDIAGKKHPYSDILEVQMQLKEIQL